MLAGVTILIPIGSAVRVSWLASFCSLGTLICRFSSFRSSLFCFSYCVEGPMMPSDCVFCSLRPCLYG
jgi:hypothetical protein